MKNHIHLMRSGPFFDTASHHQRAYGTSHHARLLLANHPAVRHPHRHTALVWNPASFVRFVTNSPNQQEHYCACKRASNKSLLRTTNDANSVSPHSLRSAIIVAIPRRASTQFYQELRSIRTMRPSKKCHGDSATIDKKN